ncbi:hypothetical protein B9T33_15305 [Acinetobacter sp. ANC 5054]|uniref:hypothetical protein n=1 Tax=Acinetobacter sp. ANC 5054 TaxID=1977877 RepID=UPI000A341AF2|nr:hypothetical protein [Acinetobacter sp. ANC 5054]OTG77293.1 hypothetical protein B9T33_15305 [Acinetobacter sp. ANC 5054]
MKKNLLSSLIFSTMTICTAAHAMTALDDQELSKVDGQALLSMEYTQGYNSVDDSGQAIDQTNVGFYKLGLEAEMELNANIKKLQLGCGGANGSGACDIDIDHISLSGLPANKDYSSDDRAATSALITNPFVEFAVKNPTSAATREVLGFRLSAEKIAGLMTFGTENSNEPNGINTFSGYMKTKESTGVATTAERVMDYASTGQYIEGAVKGTLFGAEVDLPLHYKSDKYSFNLKSTTAPFTIPATVVSGNRMTDVKLKGTGTVGRLDFSGPLEAQISLLGLNIKLNKDVTGYLTGLQTDITVDQSLGLIHALYLNNPASLSLQAQKILWPGAAVAADRGWWLAMEDEVDLGSITPSDKVAITNEVLKQTIAGINHDLSSNVRNCGDLIFGCVAGSALNVAEIKNPSLINFPLNNLKLSGQDFRSNCFGGLKFC